MTEEIEKEFRLEKEDAAELLRDIADSLEEKGSLSIEGDEWKLHQNVGTSKVPLRVYKDGNGTEIGFRLISDN